VLLACRLHGLKKGGMRRLAQSGGTSHELMAISSHQTIKMVQHYTTAVDRELLADLAMAKKQGGQIGNADVTNTKTQLHRKLRC
jgi:hypothetical protein